MCAGPRARRRRTAGTSGSPPEATPGPCVCVCAREAGDVGGDRLRRLARRPADPPRKRGARRPTVDGGRDGGTVAPGHGSMEGAPVTSGSPRRPGRGQKGRGPTAFGQAPRATGRQKGKTYNSGYSHVVTHRTTSPPVRSLSSGERTGSSVLCDLWSYVLDGRRAAPIYVRPGSTARPAFCSCSVTQPGRASRGRRGTVGGGGRGPGGGRRAPVGGGGVRRGVPLTGGGWRAAAGGPSPVRRAPVGGGGRGPRPPSRPSLPLPSPFPPPPPASLPRLPSPSPRPLPRACGARFLASGCRGGVGQRRVERRAGCGGGGGAGLVRGAGPSEDARQGGGHPVLPGRAPGGDPDAWGP